MARNKIVTNSNVFQKLERLAAARPISSADRYIATNRSEQTWLTKSKFEEDFVLDHSTKIFPLTHEGRNYFILSNIDPPELPDGLKTIPINSSLLTALLSDKDVFLPNLDGLAVYDSIFFPVEKDSYSGHDSALLLQFCVPLTLLEAESGGGFDTPLAVARVALLCASKSSGLRTLPLNQSTLDACAQLTLEESSIPVSLMSRALISVRWEHCFLDLYRCVERLFSIPTIVDLKGKLQIQQSGLAISKTLEELISWRKPEEDGLASLILDCNLIASDFHTDYIKLDTSCPPNYSYQSTAKHIYKLRNSIVHFRAITELPKLAESAWQRLVQFLVDLINALYLKYHADLKV